ncbi:MAG TPA: folylpolyglutamate synthase/dihydrofolate synthase family protein [Acidobacteriaceae bacterium]|jgi:dihydrofolate synthase/folylpolyglutamate synthase|nr:folylpolyglutamate synthase/dihydrofolate synthase family protein [Acidobacteriaceae bacterium]
MSYAAALDSLHLRVGELHAAPGQPRRKFRLEEMQTLVEALGHPERHFRSILIAGTNGKGSTAATLASILQSAGIRTGLYTSPHLSRVNERIRIDGQPIADHDFARHYFRVDDCALELIAAGRLPAAPSFFEALTALAFLAFAQASIDVAILEVGMGGRLDATNVVDPLLSVITDISLDHTEWLGDTITLIAREKAGILRRNGTLVTLPQHPEANQAIGEVAVELDVRGVNAAEYLPFGATNSGGLRMPYPLDVLGETIQIDSPLYGEHQRRNMALAIAAAVELRNHHGYKIMPAQIADGICRTRWPGRLEFFSVPALAGGASGAERRQSVLLDVAHNPAGAWTLRAALSSLSLGQSTAGAVLVFGCMKDKAFEEMAQILFPIFDLVVVTPVASPRSATAAELLEAAAKTGVRAVAATDGCDAFERARVAAPPDGLIVVAGSVYLVGEVRAMLVAQGYAGGCA